MHAKKERPVLYSYIYCVARTTLSAAQSPPRAVPVCPALPERP